MILIKHSSLSSQQMDTLYTKRLHSILFKFISVFLICLSLCDCEVIKRSDVNTINYQNNSSSNSTYLYFEEKNPDLYFQHLTVNTYTKQVYIGGVNRIYQLSAQLQLEAESIMGPQEDSSDCPVTRNCPNIQTKKLTDYYNKVLVIDYAQSRLITCGSLFQGICSVHKLDDVSSYETPASESVVANNATASTVAFIALGPAKSPKHVLYVGVSYTGNGPYRSDVPAISSRSLDSNAMFTIAATGVTTGTRLLVNSLARDRYPITYVYGFQSRGFSYFLTVQKKSTEAPRPFISKLVRICQKDPDYYSYTEVPIKCRTHEDNVDYNLAQAAFVGKPGSELATSLGITAQDDILFIVFAKSKDEADVYNKPSHNSALCVYALSAVHRKFTQNIQHCFNGNGNQGLDFINPSQSCVPTQVQIKDDFCGMDVNTPLGGVMPVEASPVLTYKNVLLTSVAATSTHDYTVVFLGTSDGYLKKAVVESSLNAFEYSNILIEKNSRVNPDMHLVEFNNKNFLYVMTERRVTMVKVQECQIYKTCGDCLGAHDPYCGWCSLENKCSLRSDCAEAAQDPLYWLSYKSGKCTTITQVHPPQIQRTTARTLSLAIDNLPALDGQFFCAFTAAGKTQITNATRNGNGVTCPTPPTDSLPPISPGQHHFTAKLSVRMKTGPDFVATNFTFYDCSSYSSCTQCVSSSFPCDWCVGGHRCTHDTGENCRNDILVTGVSSVGPSIRSGPGFCPRINATLGGSTEILVPSGITKRIQVKVDNIPQFIVSTRFICQFNIEGRVKQATAQLLGDTIYCEGLEFSYQTNQQNITTAFAVIWDGGKPLDNPENIHVLVYRCQNMAQNCGFCLELPEKYMCGWCQGSDSCQVNEQCKNHNTMMWLNRQQTCPDPKILNFYPKSGPWEGGTNITIEGINLGRHFDDISNGVSIAQEISGVVTTMIPCVAHHEGYVKTSKITCQVQSPRNLTAGHQVAQLGSIAGPIIVKVLNDYQAKSKELYSFVNPKILTMSPSKGPSSGGTKMIIEGLHMDAGSKAQVFLGPYECNVTNRHSSFIECITSERQNGPGEEKLRVKFDNGFRSFDFYNYFYVEDPTITWVESGSGRNKGEVRGIPSGGMNVSVKGTNLNVIQTPLMYVEIDGVKYVSNCTKLTPNEMRCETPTVPLEKLEFYSDDKEYIELDYGFIMDNVKGVMSLSKKKPLSTTGQYQFNRFRMFKNPIYHPFPDEDGIKYFRGEYLTINGNHLDAGSTESDVIVWIGTSTCNVTSLSRLQLTCRPPIKQPPAIDAKGQVSHNEIPTVTVSVGGKLNFTIGRLSYGSIPSDEFTFTQTILIGIIISICILFLIVVAILIAYRRKSTESNRVLKTMRDQMDVLELKVASECKEAFAELQTHLTDITNDLSMFNSGIPYLEYRNYTLKVLFPNQEDNHPVLRELQIDNPMKRANIEKGLRHFGQLIMNKTFLLLFIRTLESNRYFSMRDRVNVASLIMVTLQGKMEYCTDILKTLLSELIEKCIEGKSHPKLLLRRTESVAEKMLSSWFTFLLYKFLKECAGEPLFLLYKAIKHQIDKGPVDSLTSEARYSLSEEKLIRQQVEFKMMTVHATVSPDLLATGLPFEGVNQPIQGQPGMYQQEEMPIKVLDCDTIGQVKEKILDQIYKNVPFSQRPSKDDLDLEWRTGQSGRIVLNDEDQTTKIEGSEWKRLNTLAHYKVPDGASLNLIPKQNSLYNLSSIYHQAANQDPRFNTKGQQLYGQQVYPFQQQQMYGQQPYGQPYNHGMYGQNNYDMNNFNNKFDHKYETLNFGYSKTSTGGSGATTATAGVTSPVLSRATSPLNSYDYENGSYKYYHLIKNHDNDKNDHPNDRGSKMVSEIYLTRLLATKGTLQKFVDDLFETIFSTAHRGSTLPLAIKYMFDFLDDQSVQHGITDHEVVHTWKSNSLPLRFWVNLIKNPNFVFDIHKSNIVDSCLSVVAQTFMDACSTSEHRLGKDSPSSKLLYAKDIPIYKDWVERYYNDIRLMPSISDQDMNAMLAEESRQHSHEFNTNVSLHELYTYAIKYNDQLMQTLEEDEFARKNKLAWKLEQVHTIITGETDMHN